MPGKFIGTDGDLETTYVTDHAMIDQYAKTGSLWVWGINNGGQLGDSTITSKSSPTQTVAGGTNWRSISVGLSHSAAIKTDGSLWLTGDNAYGALGNGTTTGTSSPIQTVSATTNGKQVECGQRFTGAIKTDGTLWMWGQGGNGQLGDNTAVNKSSPVQTIAAGTNWKQVAVAQAWTAAIKTDGTLWV
jgi:alpha-tubulin suppressor-like RCC1 family protein